MNILQISTSDHAGGAERVAWTLFSNLRRRGHLTWLAVGKKHSDDPDVLEIPRISGKVWWEKPCWVIHGRLRPWDASFRSVRRLRNGLRILAGGVQEIDQALGREAFYYPGSRKLLSLPSERPDVIHAHNLHGFYFDLRYLIELSKQVPVVITLHDEWMLTGHCAYCLGCSRWELGCGQCPDLSVYPAIQRDNTQENWRRKRQIYRRSKLHVATPNRWLMNEVERSMLTPTTSKIIPYGVDLNVYYPAQTKLVRDELGLPQNSNLLLYVANNARKNPFKDYETINAAVKLVADFRDISLPIIFISLGGDEAFETQVGKVRVLHLPFESDPAIVAKYYQAADIFLHAARADNFPNTILEALACGTPVIATNVGGISEQIEDGVTGFLVPPGGVQAMAARIKLMLADDDLLQSMSEKAAVEARQRFDLKRQVDDYVDWYREILDPQAS